MVMFYKVERMRCSVIFIFTQSSSTITNTPEFARVWAGWVGFMSAEGVADPKRNARWKALATFHRAPCLSQTVVTGAAGGIAIGALRYAGGHAAVAALTWGAVVGGLLSGTQWFVCRREMYATVAADAALLQKAQTDPEALREYQARVQRRQGTRA